MDYRDKIGEIPEDWEAIKANKHLVLESGMRPSQHVTDNVNDIPSLGGENVHEDGYLVFDNVRYISREYFLKMPKGKIIDGDILINKDGANTGKIAFAKWKPFPECAVNEHLFIIRNTGDFNQDFLFYFLFSEKGNVQIQKKVVGSAQGGINNSFPKGIFLPKPPKLEQTAIATLLSKVDEAIAATQNSIKAAEKLKKALMQNLLTGKLKPDGSLRTEDDFYEDEKFGKYPKDWNFSRFKDFAVLQRGKDLTDNEVVSGEFPVVKSNGVQIYHNQFFVESPGVVTGRSGTIGKAFYIEEQFWAHNTSLYVKDFKGNYPKYIYYLILRMDFRRYYAGTTVPTLNRNDIHRLKIAIPKTEKEQKEIADKIDDCDKSLESKQTKIQTLQRLKKSLMQNLLTGKVRLPQEFIAQFEEAVDEVNKTVTAQ